VTLTRECDQCGTPFAPGREHARFCSPGCRVTWNRQHADGHPAGADALEWSIVAMRQTTGRLQRATGLDRQSGLGMISDAVWLVTMVDATLVRYHHDTYRAVLEAQPCEQREVTEDTFGGLRYVRNQMDPGDNAAGFIQVADGPAGTSAGRAAAWAWKSVPEPELAGLTASARQWEMLRYRAYQARLAGQPVGQTFRLAAGFLDLVCATSDLSRA
jgi:hypothetical protein